MYMLENPYKLLKTNVSKTDVDSKQNGFLKGVL